MTIQTESDGTLPAHAWPGGYPLYYIVADGGCLCPDCANGGNGSEASAEPEADAQWRIVGQDVHWEGEPIVCDHCGDDIESAYGNSDDDEPTEPEEGDIVVTSCGPLGGLSQAHCNGQLIAGPCPDDEIDDEIRAWIEGESYSPNVWTISDHGNAVLRNID